MDELPPEGAKLRALLRSMGVTAFDPRVINQLLDFQYRYLAELFQDAQVVAEHVASGTTDAMMRPAISLQDVVLAQELASQNTFVPAPSQACLMALATQTNSQPLPEPKPRLGLRIPPEADCILGPNYQLVPRTPPPVPSAPLPSAAPPPGSSTLEPSEQPARQLVEIAGISPNWAPPARADDEPALNAPPAGVVGGAAAAPLAPPSAICVPQSPLAASAPPPASPLLVAPPPPAAQMPDDTDDLLDPFMEEF